jgi:hypothetical protein
MSLDPGAQPVTQASGRTLTEMRPERRDALLTAIAKARGWIDDVQLGAALAPSPGLPIVT